MTTISCTPCRWSATGGTAQEVAWLETAINGHLGRPPRGGMCHAACFDDHGHTDGCLYEGA
jgi:hypothetical protein